MKKSIASLALSLILIIGLSLPISSLTAFADDGSSSVQKIEQAQGQTSSENSAIQIPQEDFGADSNNNNGGESTDQTANADFSDADNSSLGSSTEEDAISKDNASILVNGDNVWVNGKTGDDSNSGKEEFPVKTFEKAKELLNVNNADIIWVS